MQVETGAVKIVQTPEGVITSIVQSSVTVCDLLKAKKKAAVAAGPEAKVIEFD